MKRKKQIIFIILTMLMLIILGSLCTNVYAVTPTFWGACSRGVSVYYYIENGTNNAFYQRIKDAAYNWEHTGHGLNPIYLYEKSSSSGTAMDFFAKPSSFWGTNGSSIDGQTSMRNSSGTEINPESSNWLYSEIYINSTLLSGDSRYTDAIRQGVIAHEMGHAFGLKHYVYTDYARSLLYPYTFSTNNLRSVVVTAEDNEAINAKY